ncbi:MAG TPA: hypothetical protein VHH11_07500 [Gammaproteobacteria bacterium]|nr:hypothetical protein [Gammaproteobacteria bacterium]
MHCVIPNLRPLLLFAGVAALAATAYGQIDDSIRGAPSEANHFIATPKGWVHPKTPWGDPDIAAQLNQMQAAGVPLERCASSYRFGGPPCDMNKKWLTEEEYQARVKAAEERGDPSRKLMEKGDVGGAMRAGAIDPSLPQRQTNLIMDPPDGLLPALTAEGKRRALAMRSDWPLPGEDLKFDGPHDFDSWDRCITRGMPSSMMPYRYNGGFAIRQAPGYVIFDLEMIHESRVIPLDGRPAPPPEIKQWLGVSRGHFEGDTLVVVTTNYMEGPPMINLAVVGSPPGNRFPISDRMKTTERVTRLNDDWWLYEITTEDPVILTRPFTVRFPMRNDPGYLVPEYACHEDNQIVRNYTTTSRYERAHPKEEPVQTAVLVDPPVAEALDGHWVGRPRIVTIDDDIELAFIKRGDRNVNGRLVGTNFGKIDKPLRDFTIRGRLVNFTLPNIDPWRFAGELTADGNLVGVLSSAQGGLPVTFKRTTR